MAAQVRHSSHVHKVILGIGRMFTMFPYWDISWLVGVSFTIGCLIFVACGLFYWLPIAFPETEFPHEESIAGGVCAFVVATLFQIGAVLLFLESYNDRAETQFGGAVEHLFVDRLKIAHKSEWHRPKHYEMGRSPDEPANAVDEPKKHSSSEGNDVSKVQSTSKGSNALKEQPTSEGSSDSSERSSSEGSDLKHHATSGDSGENGDAGNTFTERQWQWWPSWHAVRTHYIYEIGFLASFTMSVGATIFYVCGILALPGIFENLSEGVIKGVYYMTYLVGGVLFVISSLFYILETQPNWYTPQPYKIGWWVGAWNMVGSVGWTLAASLGYCPADWCEYQSELALTWASVAFATGSAFQWYESLDKYVVIIEE